MLKNIKNRRNNKVVSLISDAAVWNGDNDRKPHAKNLSFYFEEPFTNSDIKSNNYYGKHIKNKHIDKAWAVTKSLENSGKKVLGDRNGNVYAIRSANYKQGQAGKRRAARRGGNPSVFR